MKSLLIISFLMFPVLTSFSQSRKEQRQQKKIEEFNSVKELVESRNYEFIADRALPQRGGSKDLTTTSNFLRVTDSIAYASLPFYGRAYNVAYGGPGGINFKGEIYDFSLQENEKKLNLVLSFKVKGDADQFDCIFTISSGTSVTLSVTSQQRDPISYYGMLKTMETDEK